MTASPGASTTLLNAEGQPNDRLPLALSVKLPDALEAEFKCSTANTNIPSIAKGD